MSQRSTRYSEFIVTTLSQPRLGDFILRTIARGIDPSQSWQMSLESLSRFCHALRDHHFRFQWLPLSYQAIWEYGTSLLRHNAIAIFVNTGNILLQSQGGVHASTNYFGREQRMETSVGQMRSRENGFVGVSTGKTYR